MAIAKKSLVTKNSGTKAPKATIAKTTKVDPTAGVTTASAKFQTAKMLNN